MPEATAVSPANIAFIKYWGNKNSRLNLPFNDSVSMNLSHCLTECSVSFNRKLKTDRIIINHRRAEDKSLQKVVDFLNIIRRLAKSSAGAEVFSVNNFPAAAGIASSASAFSALALAATKALGLDLSQKQLSILSRLGSGSACRSVIDGFAYWHQGDGHKNSYAVQLAPAHFWRLCDIVTIVNPGSKKISSSQGHRLAQTSPYFKVRRKILPERIKNLKKALLDRNFPQFGELLETEAIDLHLIAMTSKPPIFYWQPETLEIIQAVRDLRIKGFNVYFTIDAGANVHVICLKQDAAELNHRLRSLKGVVKTIVNYPASGARLIR